jgi:Ala-tRNA(Pro) deacylase
MTARRLRDLLDRAKVKYVVVSHSPAYTAQEVAESAHVSGKMVAKAVVFQANDRMSLAVLPASCRIRLPLLEEATGAKPVRLATEAQFQSLFPDCEVGAMPPFGNLYRLEVWVDDSLQADEKIAFNAGSHRELFILAYRDFERLVKPRVAHFAI